MPSAVIDVLAVSPRGRGYRRFPNNHKLVR
jgi:hypothetical protein